jgi:hypothetical protein
MFTEHPTRRDLLKLAAAGVAATSTSGWFGLLADRAARAASQGTKHKSCILLWMAGGPAQSHTWDLKPGGDYKPISTAVSGIQISEHLPKIAKHMHEGVVVRGMSTPEGAHARASYNLHTGYREGQGGLIYPSLGSIVACETGKPDASVPAFISIGNRSFGSGFLGPKHQPLLVQNPATGVEDLKAIVNDTQFEKRIALLEEMEKAFQGEYRTGTILDHKTTYERAVKLMHSKESKAFDLSQESPSTRERYEGGAGAVQPKGQRGGGNRFGDGVLMARRLVEVGVPFVEVTLGGWDTHQENFERVKGLSGQIDSPIAALLDDLKERGLLDSTLVVWMGEFGRTPNINQRGPKPGRDHYPRAWSLAMWGGGIKGGRVIGKTDADGAAVVEQKVGCPDFLATVCELMGVDHTKKNETATGRPVTIVDKPKPITSLLV